MDPSNLPRISGPNFAQALQKLSDLMFAQSAPFAQNPGYLSRSQYGQAQQISDDRLLKPLQYALQSGQITPRQFLDAVSGLGFDPGAFDFRGPAGNTGPRGGSGH